LNPDGEKTIRRPTAVAVLVLATALVFLAQAVTGPGAAVARFGSVPYYLTHPSASRLPAEKVAGLGDEAVPPPIPGRVGALFTATFLHADFIHLLLNLFFLWIFGGAVEEALGAWRFVLLYLGCGGAGALVHALAHPGSPLPLVGASGAVSGVMGAFFALFPRRRVTPVLPLVPFFLPPAVLPASVFLGLWFLVQILSLGAGPETAFLGHVSGFLLGAVWGRAWGRRSSAGPVR